jgi:hypothetical protein
MAEWKFETQNVVILCGQRRYDEHSAILATVQWTLRDYACSDVETSANAPGFTYPYA